MRSRSRRIKLPPYNGPLIYAKQRPMNELPSWAVCCDQMRAVYAEDEAKKRVPECIVIPQFFWAEVECQFCHRIVKDVKYMQVCEFKKNGWKPKGKFVIPVDCFEFDERPVNP